MTAQEAAANLRFLASQVEGEGKAIESMALVLVGPNGSAASNWNGEAGTALVGGLAMLQGEIADEIRTATKKASIKADIR